MESQSQHRFLRGVLHGLLVCVQVAGRVLVPPVRPRPRLGVLESAAPDEFGAAVRRRCGQPAGRAP